MLRLTPDFETLRLMCDFKTLPLTPARRQPDVTIEIRRYFLWPCVWLCSAFMTPHLWKPRRLTFFSRIPVRHTEFEFFSTEIELDCEFVSPRIELDALKSCVSNSISVEINSIPVSQTRFLCKKVSLRGLRTHCPNLATCCVSKCHSTSWAWLCMNIYLLNQFWYHMKL